MTSRACHACHQPIAPKRLEALPHTRWCVRCAETRVVRVGGVMRACGDSAEIDVVPSIAEAQWLTLTEVYGVRAYVERIPQEAA